MPSDIFINLELIGLLLIGISIPLFIYNLFQIETDYTPAVANMIVAVVFAAIGTLIVDESEKAKRAWIMQFKTRVNNMSPQENIATRKKISELLWEQPLRAVGYSTINLASKAGLREDKEEDKKDKKSKKKKPHVVVSRKCKYCGKELNNKFIVEAVGENLLRFCSVDCADSYKRLVRPLKEKNCKE